MSKILICSSHVIGDKIAGPGLRYLEIARALSKNHEVTLATPNKILLKNEKFRSIKTNFKNIWELLAQNEIIMADLFRILSLPYLLAFKKKIVVDLFNLSFIENLEIISKENTKIFKNKFQNCHFLIKIFILHLLIGDFFICSNERQRDFWLGMLSTLGRINIENYKQDKNLRKLIDVVSFGVPKFPPQHKNKVLKGVHENIQLNDYLIIWGGGIWDWFDPISPILAINNIVKYRQDIKLFFMGSVHPNPNIPKMEMYFEALNLSKKLGLFNKYIFFGKDWIPYAERENYYLETDLAISTHFDILESRYAFRTRFMDYLWADLPIICTRGDEFSNLVEKENLGITVLEKDIKAIEAAIIKLIEDQSLFKHCKENLKRIKDKFSWDKVVKPLDDFCASPYKSKKNINPVEFTLKFSEIGFNVLLNKLRKTLNF
ncbi:MAG: glycosyltransferase [Armatimonadetes bacterium]|nr:glycosyltransferase [Armatimonadota bacterium]